MKTAIIRFALAIVIGSAPLAFSQTPKQEAKDAGHDVKEAGKATGRAAKHAGKATAKTAKRTGHKVKKTVEKDE
jgi:hypothetical protein